MQEWNGSEKELLNRECSIRLGKLDTYRFRRDLCSTSAHGLMDKASDF
jgi:hypothetical protein